MASLRGKFLIILLYVVVVYGSMYYSSKVTQKRLYDRFVVSGEGLVVPTADAARSASFYRDVLDFKPFYHRDLPKEDKNIAGFILAKAERIFLVSKETYYPAAAPSNTTAVIRVRNGFEKLNKALAKRTARHTTVPVTAENYLNVSETGCISSIVTVPWGKEFVAYDPDGNKVIFLEPRRRSWSRYN